MPNAWKIARKSNAQLPLLIVIALAVVLVLVGKAQSGLFDKARARVTDFLKPALELVHAPVQRFDRWMGSVGDVFDLYNENLRLKDENARLRQWRNVAVVLQGRVTRYQGLLHAVPDPKLQGVLAKVIGRSSRPFMQTLVLDAGAGAHVMPGEAVMDDRGMIGRVYLAGSRTSWVIPLTDPNSRIPVAITGGNGKPAQAILGGDNSAAPHIEMLLSTVTLHAGDQVNSSGDGGLLPAGLPIGTVIDNHDGTWRVALLADPAASQDVEVLKFSAPPENPPANAELPAVAAGQKPYVPPPAPLKPAPEVPKPIVPKPASVGSEDQDR